MAGATRTNRPGSIVVACVASCGCVAYDPTIQHVMEPTVKPEDATYDTCYGSSATTAARPARPPSQG